jgi:hypothetical protein
MTARGISLFAGGFPNEYTLIEQIKSGSVNRVDNWFYAYLAGIIVMTAVAYGIQRAGLARARQ